MKKSILDKLHSTQLEILKELDRVCKKNNIEYFLVGGTLLGAVRHKGFIPWDDDIDVGMTRDNYEKLCSLPNYEFADKYLLNCFKTNKKCSNTFAKLINKNTKFVERKHFDNYDEKYSGIWIDIFPFDGVDVPFNEEHKKKDKKLRRYFTLINIKNGTNYYQNSKIKKLIYTIILKFVPIKCLINVADKTIIYTNGDKPKYYCNYSGAYCIERDTQRNDAILPIGKINFEGIKFMCPNNCNDFLKLTYGDYMKLPPIDKRVTHDPYCIKFEDGEEFIFDEKK